MSLNHNNNETITLDDSDDSVIITESEKKEDESIFQEDWDNFKKPNNSDAQVVICDFFLIMEINRLVPYMHNTNLKFHPMNMPHIKIGKITVAGFVTDVKESFSHIDILIEDGTGALRIRYDQKQYTKDQDKRKEILNKYREFATNINDITFDDSEMVPKALPKIRPGFNYPGKTPVQKIAMLEHKWWLEAKKGLLGKTIIPTDYVRASGYCHLDFQFQFSSRSSEEIAFDHLCKAKPIFMATKVECIEEVSYNKQIKQWMNIGAKRRYKISQAMT